MTEKYRNPMAWAQYRALVEDPTAFPFAFRYNGEKISGFPTERFTLLSKETAERDEKIETRMMFALDDTLRVCLQYDFYPLHGVSEWTVTFANPGKANSGVISDAVSVLVFDGAYPMLKGIWGDLYNQYRPYAMDLSSNPVYFESNSGRPTHIRFPYFNLEHGDGGTMLAIGWSGTWRADFRYDKKTGKTTYTARSVNGLHTYLKPGESIRTALFVCAPYTVREEHYAANYWRSWFVHSNLPHADRAGTPLKPFSTAWLAPDTGIPNSDGSISERYDTWRPSLEKMFEEEIHLDVRWLDAGWYIAPDGRSPDGFTRENDWHNTVGTWVLDPVKWPGNTFRESTDFARDHGMKTMMWFEPERVTDVPNLAKNYGYDPAWAIHGRINNIGNPDCYAWTLGQITKTLTENRVEIYREDNNCNPGEVWHDLDEAEGNDRAGFTESHAVESHYRLWDAIIDCTTSYGGCAFVDSCASGGGRNDLESLRRGIPFLRSDSDRTTTALRLSMTTAFNKWIPFCGANNKEKVGQLDPTGVLDMYVWRASYLPILNVDSQYVQDPDQDFEVLRRGLREWRRMSPYMLCDFYTLTPWHTEGDDNDFTAFSYFDEAQGEGVLLAFRQEMCNESVLSVTLPYIREDAVCELLDEDSGEILCLTGREMADRGFTLTFDEPRSARLLWVREVR